MKVGYTATALAHLDSLPHDARERILTKVHFYARQENPLKFAEHLTGYDAYRFRVGIYRVMFEVRNDELFVLRIKKRDKAYGDLYRRQNRKRTPVPGRNQS